MYCKVTYSLHPQGQVKPPRPRVGLRPTCHTSLRLKVPLPWKPMGLFLCSSIGFSSRTVGAQSNFVFHIKTENGRGARKILAKSREFLDVIKKRPCYSCSDFSESPILADRDTQTFLETAEWKTAIIKAPFSTILSELAGAYYY